MAFKQNDMSGSLFRNQDKKTDSHPDYTGSAKIDGTEFWISGWLNESREGRKYLSLKFKEKEDVRTPRKNDADQFDDDIPF